MTYREEHRKKGEDPSNWKIVMKDVEDSLKEAMELIKKAAEERGIDLNVLPEVEYEHPNPDKHPFYKSVEKYRKLAHKFLKRLKEAIQEEGISLSQRIEIVPSPEEKARNFKELTFSYEVILWYHTLISAKIYRALCQKESESDEELAKTEKSDADGSAKVAYLGLVNSIRALQKIYPWNEDLQDEILTLLVEAGRLRKGIDKIFPGHRKFKRPGFDQ